MTKKLTFCSLMAVLGILCLVLSNLLQTNTVFLYLFSTLFTYICTEEHGLKYGLLTYGVISLGGFMLVADKVSIIIYAIMVGYYPVIKHIVEHFNVNKALKRIFKFIFIVLASLIAFAGMKGVLRFKFYISLIVVVGIIVFVLLDVALKLGLTFYALRLRNIR